MTGAWLLAAGYLLFGLAWIVFSDSLGAVFFSSAQALTRFQTWKGAGFVAFSAVVVLLAAGSARRARTEQPAGAGSPVVVLLSMLVLATGLPMIALLGWHILREAQTLLDGSKRMVAEVADNTSSDIATFLDTQVRTAGAMAQRPAVRRLDAAACDPLLLDAPGILDSLQEVSTFDADGRLVCGRRERAGQPPPAWHAQLRASGLPVVGPVGKDPFAGMWTFTVVHPILDDRGAVAGAVELLMPATVLVNLLETPMPDQGAVSLLDQANTVVSRWPGPREYVGRRLTDGTRVRQVRELRNFTASGPDGVVRLYGSHAVGATGWVVVAGVPTDSLYQPARQGLLRSLAAGLAIVALCSWLVMRLARTITGPMRALRRTAEAAALGDFSLRAPEAGPAELVAVAGGVNHMLERLPELQREIREGAERTRELVEKLSRHVPSMSFIHERRGDGPGRMLFTSEAVRTILELEPDDLRRDAGPAFERIHPLDLQRVQDAIKRSGAALSFLAMEYRVVLPRQGVRHVFLQAQPERVDGGGVAWYGSVTDVTELHASQQALWLMNETLEHRIAERTAALASANDALESFSYSVAHDLRAPLHSIEGFAQAMAHALRKGDTVRATAFSERVVANAARMNVLIDGFLALARAGRVALVDSPVDLQRLVAEVVAELGRPPKTQLRILAPLPRVLADQATLR
ncbi:MAG: sensor histidine kinase, partial [Ramlibacter sp.]